MRLRRGIAFVATIAALNGAIALPFALPIAPSGATTTSDGVVFAFGVARFGGSPGSAPPGPLVAITGTRDGAGYWVLRADGGVYHYGSAAWYGAPDTLPGGIPSPATAMAAAPDGHGYWVVSHAGNVYAYGSAHSFGQPGANGGIVGIAPTVSGHGYWLVDATGGVFTFGDAAFLGSAYGHPYHGGIVGISATPSGNGYWLVAADGTIFGFGDAVVVGSAWGIARHPIVGMAPTVTGIGYWLVDSAGGLYRFGDAAMAPQPHVTDPRINAPGHTTPRLSSTDTNAAVHSPSLDIDRHVTGIAAAAGLHSIWVLADQYAGGVILESLGASGSAVVTIQQMLVARGFWVPVTGVFDNDTQQAVWAFQKYWGFNRTGYITAADYRALKIAPHVQARSGSGTLVEIDKTRQVLFVIQNGVTVWAFSTSTGGGYPFNDGGATQLAITPTGVFHIIRQVDGLDIGPLGALWRPKYFTPGGIAIHGDSSVPPYPVSHGCARVSNDAIDFMWATNALPIGLEVWVYT